ncbi:hypothetical protein [Phycicoccus avicenniae]|uniref:hypothetical protein n=1 Tax=Phycicoccus avicenniae TaxID=2828860 RepID=UPI0020118BBA|nr:hypothetical protein [Phycicoccus avicenniae]
MPDLRSRRLVGLLAAAGVAVVVLTAVRGVVVLLAVASLLLAAAVGLGLLPLLRRDDVDWDWLPGRAEAPTPEPGLARLHRLVAPSATDTTADRELHDLVGTLADERGATGRPGPLADYLAGPPRRLDLAALEAVVDDLDTVPPPEEHP